MSDLRGQEYGRYLFDKKTSDFVSQARKAKQGPANELAKYLCMGLMLKVAWWVMYAQKLTWPMLE